MLHEAGRRLLCTGPRGLTQLRWEEGGDDMTGLLLLLSQGWDAAGQGVQARVLCYTLRLQPCSSLPPWAALVPSAAGPMGTPGVCVCDRERVGGEG